MSNSFRLDLVAKTLKRNGEKGLEDLLSQKTDKELLEFHKAINIPKELVNKEINKRDIL